MDPQTSRGPWSPSRSGTDWALTLAVDPGGCGPTLDTAALSHLPQPHAAQLLRPPPSACPLLSRDPWQTSAWKSCFSLRGIGPTCVHGQVHGQCLPPPGSPPPQPAGPGCSAPSGSQASPVTEPQQMRPGLASRPPPACGYLPGGPSSARPVDSGWGRRVTVRPAGPAPHSLCPRVPRGPGARYSLPAGASNARRHTQKGRAEGRGLL